MTPLGTLGPMGDASVVKVRLPAGLYERLEAARGASETRRVAREQAIREGIELWCEREEESTAGGTESRARVIVEGREVRPQPTDVRLGVEVAGWGGCPEHPTAGATESRGHMWCAEPGCARSAELR